MENLTNNTTEVMENTTEVLTETSEQSTSPVVKVVCGAVLTALAVWGGMTLYKRKKNKTEEEVEDNDDVAADVDSEVVDEEKTEE